MMRKKIKLLLVVSILLSVAIGIIGNQAAEYLPEWLSILVWPILVILIAVYIFISIRLEENKETDNTDTKSVFTKNIIQNPGRDAKFIDNSRNYNSHGDEKKNE
jgi:uncharacterized membrane protein YfcA